VTITTDPGLCRALSRGARATVIVDPDTDSILRQAETPGDTGLAIQRQVLAALLAIR
jgi:hypothetical protein